MCSTCPSRCGMMWPWGDLSLVESQAPGPPTAAAVARNPWQRYGFIRFPVTICWWVLTRYLLEFWVWLKIAFMKILKVPVETWSLATSYSENIIRPHVTSSHLNPLSLFQSAGTSNCIHLIHDMYFNYTSESFCLQGALLLACDRIHFPALTNANVPTHDACMLSQCWHQTPSNIIGNSAGAQSNMISVWMELDRCMEIKHESIRLRKKSAKTILAEAVTSSSAPLMWWFWKHNNIWTYLVIFPQVLKGVHKCQRV